MRLRQEETCLSHKNHLYFFYQGYRVVCKKYSVVTNFASFPEVLNFYYIPPK